MSITAWFPIARGEKKRSSKPQKPQILMTQKDILSTEKKKTIKEQEQSSYLLYKRAHI